MNKMREKEKTGDVTVRGMAEVGFEDEQKEGDLRRKQREKHFRRRRRGVRKEEEEKRRRRKSFNVGGISSNENSCAGSGTSFLLTAESCGGGSRSGSGSVLSTISASADRCFIGSNRDSLFPHLTHLAGRSRCSGSGQDPDLERKKPSVDIHITKTIQHGSKACAETDQEITGSRKEDQDEEVRDEGIEATILDPAKHSFSLALRECQNRRFRSEWVPSALASLGNQRKRRPASLDLNSHMSDTSISSPRSLVFSGVSKKNSTASIHNQSGMFLSPGTPNYRHGGGLASGYQKGWSSERVPLPVNAGRRFGSSAALLPLGNGGKTLPSKWEDAEKWICSPVSGDGDGVGIKGGHSGLPPHHRRPKSKSGPLGGAPGRIGVSYSSSASPALSGFDSEGIPNFLMNSPFIMGGVILEDLGSHGKTNDNRGENGDVCGRGEGRSHSAQSEHGMVRSSSVHGWSDMLMESSSSLPSSQDDKHDGSKDDGTAAPSVIIRKDMATQMSPESSNHSSSKGWSQPSSPPHSSHTIGELHNHFSKLEVRDVQVDDRVTVTRWSKKHIARGLDRSSASIIHWKKKTVDAPTSDWEVAGTTKCLSRSNGEEAKITAWENLQKAKAEAAIQKLEMKLEKKRSNSMDKILKKLRHAQRKAQDMQNATNANQPDTSTTTKKALAFRKMIHTSSLTGCFSCHAF